MCFSNQVWKCDSRIFAPMIFLFSLIRLCAADWASSFWLNFCEVHLIVPKNNRLMLFDEAVDPVFVKAIQPGFCSVNCAQRINITGWSYEYVGFWAIIGGCRQLKIGSLELFLTLGDNVSFLAALTSDGIGFDFWQESVTLFSTMVDFADRKLVPVINFSDKLAKWACKMWFS